VSAATGVLSDGREREAQLIDSLRSHYEAKGFTFKVSPSSLELPDFFDSYAPDALARRPGLNIAIHVLRRPSLGAQQSVQDIRRLFEKHPDWQLQVVYAGADPLDSVLIPRAQPDEIRKATDEVAALTAEGRHRAAFVMAWSLLEAALLHSLSDEASGKARTASSVVQALAMNGYIDLETERRVRSLVALRNRVVHGDLSAEPTAADVQLVLSAIEETLSAGSATKQE
jgi:uncharacterized protein YutE (UPF0331/DUF86 family)